MRGYADSFIIALLLLSTVFAHGRDFAVGDKNPLLKMVGKPFSEYHDTCMYVASSLLGGDSLSRARLVTLFDEAAAVDKSGEWELISRIVKHTVLFYESRKGGYICSPDYTAEDFSSNMQALARSAGEKGFPLIRIFGLYQAAEGYRIFVQDYEQAFACYLEAAAEMETLTTKEFPPRTHIYNQIADLYYIFREYADALKYYGKVVADPDGANNYYRSLNLAINGMALSYRNGYGDYERSDSCFMRLLELTKSYEPDRIVWEGITEANIGRNYYLQGKLDVALSWLIPAIGKITRPNDYAVASQHAVDIADIYLRKGDPATAKKYIDMALDYYVKTRIPEKDSEIYSVLTCYHTFIGNSKLATAYLDSTLKAKERENNAFSGLVLQRIEQKLRAADLKIHEQELKAEQVRSHIYMRIAVLVSIALVVILILLGLTLFFYRRKRNAYRILVRKSQQWAGVETPEEQIEPEEFQPAEIDEVKPVIDNYDRLIMTEIEKSMTNDKLYKRTDLTLDVLAKETGFNRYSISLALNRCTGKNFNSYVNEYRVKEAVRIISELSETNLTTDALAFESGFNDRQSLHRVFKKMTGLSPGNFRKNMVGK